MLQVPRLFVQDSIDPFRNMLDAFFVLPKIMGRNDSDTLHVLLHVFVQ